MRLFALTPLLVLAACSEGAEAPKQEETKAPAAELSAGQWEVTSEVTGLTKRDAGPPAIKAAEGDKTTAGSCVAEADVKKPQPGLFVGKDYDCSYRDIYMSSGRINATLSCQRPGLPGSIAILVNGSYTADTFEGTSILESSLTSAGDVKIESKLTGKRTGACTAEAG
jgi:hypothetical protein